MICQTLNIYPNMNHAKHIRAKWNSSTDMIRSCIFHIVFFWSRIAVLCIGISLNASNVIKYSRIEFNILFDALKYFYQFNIFLLYVVIDSTIRENIFKYYFSIVIMFHNAILFFAFPATFGFAVSFRFWFFTGLCILSFIFEGLITLYISYLNRNAKNLELFKKVGASPKVNDAFATRKALETFGQANMFLIFVLIEVFWIPADINIQLLQIANYLIVLLTFVQQITISVRFNDEHVTQRKIAIGLSYLKIFSVIGLIAWRGAVHLNGNTNTRIDFFHTVFDADILIASIIMQYYLIKDFKQFGSGLKEHFKKSAKSIDLRSNIKQKRK